MARALGVSQQAVFYWRTTQSIPVKRIRDVIAAAARLNPPVKLTPADFF